MNLSSKLTIILSAILFALFSNPLTVYSISSSTMKNNIKFVTEKEGIKEFQLSNGLKVLLKPSSSFPLVTFSIWYKVGARNETDGIRGIAHFLEHMMFKGTKKLKKGKISEIIQNYGGVFNAFTSCDCTAYYETVSPKYLEKIIEIESDRLSGSLLDANELNLERTVVLSELEGNLNDPTTLLDNTIRYEAYEKSPYKNPTIGYENDIKNINSGIMRDFYKKYYSPNNSTIVVVGDIEESKVLNLIQKYFGNIKKCPREETSIVKDELQNNEKRVKVKRAGSFKLLEIVYHIPEAKDKDIYPLNIIEEILIKSKKSPLNKALIEKGLATEIYGGAEANKDPGLFYILVSLTPKAKHKQVEKIVLNEINKLIKKTPSEDEINTAKNRIKAAYLFNLDGSFQQALNIGYFETINDWKQSIDWVKDITKVTKEDVKSSFSKYFQKENRTIGYFIPVLQKGNKYEAQPLSLSKTQHYKNPREANITTNHLNSYNKPFKYKKVKLKDGSEVFVYNNIDLPVTYISGIIKGGSSLLAKEQEWECEAIARTIEKGSKNYTKENVEDILDNTGSAIDFACDEEAFKYSSISLNDNLRKTVDLLLDLLMNPVFLKNEINIEKKKMHAEIIEAKDDTQEIARRRFHQVLYPKEHPFYINNFDEDMKLIKKLNNSSLHNDINTIIKDNKSIITLVTSLNSKELDEIIKLIEEKLYTGKTKQEGKIAIPDTLPRENPLTESIFVKDKLQSDVYLGHVGNLKRTEPDFYKLHVANYILGGSSLSSRLSKKVRDNAGLVYTVYSYISASHSKGEFGIYFGANSNNVDKAIELIKDELKHFVKDGITESELKHAKASLIDSFVSRNLSTYRNITNTISGLEYFDLGNNYINDYPKIINSLKLNEINTAIKKYIFPDKLNIVIAGEYKKEK